MVQLRSGQRLSETPPPALPYRKRSADDEPAPPSSVKKPKRSTPRAKLPIRPTQDAQDETVDNHKAAHRTGDVQEPEESEVSIYATPATHHAESEYATPFEKMTTRSATRKQMSAVSSSKTVKPTASPDTIRETKDEHPHNDPVARGIRFDSEAPSVGQYESSLPAQPGGHKNTEEAADDVNGTDDGDSSDEAPEEVTHGAAAQKARDVQAAAAYARQALDIAARDRRRRKEELLQQRARQAKEHQVKVQKQSAKETALIPAQDDDDVNEEASTVDAMMLENDVIMAGVPRHLPKYLPQALLDAAPAIRPLSPPATSHTTSLVTTSKANQLALLNPRRPKDVKRGPVKVRVMGDMEHLKYLPPKASSKHGSQREVRDTWLLGRPGRQGQAKGVIGSGKMERKSWGGSGGFLRR